MRKTVYGATDRSFTSCGSLRPSAHSPDVLLHPSPTSLLLASHAAKTLGIRFQAPKPNSSPPEPPFPSQEWTGESSVADAVLETARRLPRAKVVVTTRGTKGSVLLRRAAPGEQVCGGAVPSCWFSPAAFASTVC
jgi:hypothetical protein